MEIKDILWMLGCIWLGFSVGLFADVQIMHWRWWAIVMPVAVLLSLGK